MSQRTKILTQIVGFRGWIVAEHHWESRSGARLKPVQGYDVPPDARLVLVLSRRFTPRCAKCLAIGGTCHEQQPPRWWADLPYCGHPVVIEYVHEHRLLGVLFQTTRDHGRQAGTSGRSAPTRGGFVLITAPQ